MVYKSVCCMRGNTVHVVFLAVAIKDAWANHALIEWSKIPFYINVIEHIILPTKMWCHLKLTIHAQVITDDVIDISNTAANITDIIMGGLSPI